jgi:hypothetical protein
MIQQNALTIINRLNILLHKLYLNAFWKSILIPCARLYIPSPIIENELDLFPAFIKWSVTYRLMLNTSGKLQA